MRHLDGRALDGVERLGTRGSIGSLAGGPAPQRVGPDPLVDPKGRAGEGADAPLPALAKAIRRGGLGPTKAVRIRAMLRGIRDGGMPLDDRAFTAMKDQDLWDALVALPGVGPKTAACVLLFSLDRPYFPVDTHVHRVAIRLGLVPPRSDAVATQAAFQESVPDDEMYALHMNLIRHGREVCTAQRPRCSECVLRDLCPRVGVTSSR